MRGKVGGDKFPVGIYHVRIETADSFVSKKGNEMVKVYYRVLDGNAEGLGFSEFFNFVSAKFLTAIGEPAEIGAEWNTEQWQNKELWVHVKYSEDANAYPRYAHHATAPLEWTVPASPAPSQGKVEAIDTITTLGEDEGDVPF